jgi:DegV family protein with EDD domain
MLALVTDSTCGLTRDEARELGVDIVPMSYVADGVRHAEGFVGETGDYADLFRRSHLVTSEAVRPSAVRRALRPHLEAGDDVVCLTISSRLSGTFRSAEQAARTLRAQYEDGPQICVVDSWLTAGALEFMVRRARLRADQGVSLDEIVRDLERERRARCIAFSVPDLRALHRSGRLGAFGRSVATKLNRYPVMLLEEGGIVEAGYGRGAHGMGTALVRLAGDGAHSFVISHFGERGVEAQQLLVALHKRFPHALVRVKDGGPVLAKHLGLGAVGLSWE